MRADGRSGFVTAEPATSILNSCYDDLVAPLFRLPAKLPASAWTGHIPFLFVLFQVLKPKTFVELGVQYGGALIAAASAAQHGETHTRIFGVDTWQGDKHTGSYDGEAAFGELHAYLRETFPDVRLIRSTFDEARSSFQPASVDLLHIDGLHTYEAVRHDFETWRDAMSANGAILFHDIAVRRDDFGVWRLWDELKAQYAHIEFNHSQGLGVAFMSIAALPAGLRMLVEQPAEMAGYARLADSMGETVGERLAAARPNEPLADEVTVHATDENEALPIPVASQASQERSEFPGSAPRIQETAARTTPISALERKPGLPAIAAILPLYNGAPYIRGSLMSILGQTHPAAEIIVVDDGSTDDGPKIVRQMQEEFPAIRLISKENGGQSSARNLGVLSAISPLIAFIDQDDAWYPTHLQRLARPFSQQDHFRLGWVYSDVDIVNREGEMVTRRLLGGLPSIHPKENLAHCLGHEMMILPTASVISRQAFNAVGGFDERLSGYEDDDLYTRMFRAGFKNIFVRDALSLWRIYPGSTSYTPRMARSRMIYFRKLTALYPNDVYFGLYYVRDLIAPRFVRSVMAEALRTIRLRDKAAFQMFAKDLAEVASHLGGGRGRLMRLTKWAWSSYVLSSFVVASGLGRIARRWLG